MLFVARGMKVALQADDGFSKLLAAGLTFGFAVQTFIIVGGVLRVIPLTGITLPFVSYGGSSVVANFVLLAGLLLVSHRANTPMNAQISRLALVALVLLSALIAATTYWQAWAAGGLAAKQDNEIQRVAQFRIRRGLIYASDGKTVLAANRAVKQRRPDALLPPLPDARLRVADGRLLDAGTLARRHRARGERVPDGVEREPRHDLRQADRQPEGHDGDGEQPDPEPARRRPAHRRVGARGQVRRRGACSTRRRARCT